MNRALRVLVATDSFPPLCGGSGWSTWELVRGLAARGHAVEVLHVDPAAPAGVVERTDGGIRVTTFGVNAPAVPVVRNVIKNERLWRNLTRYLVRGRLDRTPVDLIHAQHVMTTVPAIRAGLATGIPVVATVRDYWPVCYWSDLIYDPRQPRLCPACSAGMMTRCVRPRAGVATPLAWGLIPYMRANLRTKRRTLARASAVIAVSTAIARDLRTRAPELSASAIHTIPNPIDMTALDRAHADSAPPLDGPYVLYAGKLATNKGVQYLLAACERAGLRWPLVVAGDGPLRGALESDARRRGMDVRVLGWRDRVEVWAWMRHATLLAFPSYGPESLSRVLLEAAALGVPIAAMETGGTADILRDGVTGLLSTDPDMFAEHLARLAADPSLRATLGAAARTDVHQRFSAAAVVERVESVYAGLLAPADRRS
jgi:glycosyltransferase involved in cell wall biosynthesis